MKLTIGNVEIQAIQDNAAFMNPAYFIPQYADQFVAEYGHMADERGFMPMSLTSFLVRSAGKTILIDSGVGPRRRGGLPRGKLDQALATAGIDPAEIDVVLHTHLHVDHVGWNTVDNEDGSKRIFFPNATFVIQQPEWDYWMRPEFMDGDSDPHLRECVQPVADAGKVRFFPAGETTFDENLTFVATPGHTPGHVAVGIYSGGERAIVVGDASHHPMQLDHPDWSPAFDTDPVQSAKTRDALFEAAIADGRLWLAGHWEYPGAGRILRLDGKRVFKAI